MSRRWTTTGAYTQANRGKHRHRHEEYRGHKRTDRSPPRSLPTHTGAGQIDVRIEGGEVRAHGLNSHAIQLGEVNNQGEVERAAEVGEDGLPSPDGHGGRRGVWRPGPGSRDIPGRRRPGFHRAPGQRRRPPPASQSAPRGSTPVEGGDPLQSNLYLDMNLDGRRVAQVIGADWILNDGGQTTIVVNEVKLHDGVEGRGCREYRRPMEPSTSASGKTG